jgi:replicative DNA helicase
LLHAIDLGPASFLLLLCCSANEKILVSAKSKISLTPRPFSKLDELSKLDGNITGLTTGFLELDNKTSGMQPGLLASPLKRPEQVTCYIAKHSQPNSWQK